MENGHTPVFGVEHVEHDDNVTAGPPTHTYADEKAGAKVADVEVAHAKDADTIAPEQPK